MTNIIERGIERFDFLDRNITGWMDSAGRQNCGQVATKVRTQINLRNLRSLSSVYTTLYCQISA